MKKPVSLALCLLLLLSLLSACSVEVAKKSGPTASRPTAITAKSEGKADET